MSRNRQARAPRAGAAGRSGRAEQVLDLDRYVPALITFIANKLSRSATVVYQKRFGVNVTEWRILSLLAIEPEISAARICHVIGFDKGPVSRTLAAMEKRGLVAIKSGEVDYLSEPGEKPESGSCLTCICKPRSNLVLDA